MTSTVAGSRRDAGIFARRKLSNLSSLSSQVKSLKVRPLGRTRTGGLALRTGKFRRRSQLQEDGSLVNLKSRWKTVRLRRPSPQIWRQEPRQNRKSVPESIQQRNWEHSALPWTG